MVRWRPPVNPRRLGLCSIFGKSPCRSAVYSTLLTQIAMLQLTTARAPMTSIRRTTLGWQRLRMMPISAKGSSSGRSCASLPSAGLYRPPMATLCERRGSCGRRLLACRRGKSPLVHISMRASIFSMSGLPQPQHNSASGCVSMQPGNRRHARAALSPQNASGCVSRRPSTHQQAALPRQQFGQATQPSHESA
jgi:hypothetical protein